VGDGGQFSATNIGTDCFGNGFIWYNVQAKATSWTTTNAAIATVSSTGYGYCAGPGFATVAGHFTVKNYYLMPPLYSLCAANSISEPAPAPVNVNPPNHLVMVSDQTGVLSLCNGVYGRELALNTVDVNGRPVIGAFIQETQPNYISVTTNTCGNGQPKPATCKDEFPTTAEFVDNIGINSCNIPITTCGYNIQYEWQWCGSPTAGAPVNIGKFTDVVNNNQITVNGVASPLTRGGQNFISIAPGTAIRP
jgi:hypothetical protein